MGIRNQIQNGKSQLKLKSTNDYLTIEHKMYNENTRTSLKSLLSSTLHIAPSWQNNIIDIFPRYENIILTKGYSFDPNTCTTFYNSWKASSSLLSVHDHPTRQITCTSHNHINTNQIHEYSYGQRKEEKNINTRNWNIKCKISSLKISKRVHLYRKFEEAFISMTLLRMTFLKQKKHTHTFTEFKIENIEEKTLYKLSN